MKRPPSRPPRLLPQRPLPPYSYVTGKFPHPTRDAQGHSFGQEEPTPSVPTEGAWRACQPYRWGIDLFNHGYYWEAHEAWESVWHAAGRHGPIADFCKALIKLAAAGVKAREGRPGGVEQHARRARQLLESVAAHRGTGQRHFMGLALPTLIRHAAGLARDPHAVLNRDDAPVVIVMPFALQADAGQRE